MAEISISLNADLQKKLAKLAKKNGQSFDEVIAKALSSYVEEYEDVYKTDLCAVDNLERSFFLSIGE